MKNTTKTYKVFTAQSNKPARFTADNPKAAAKAARKHIRKLGLSVKKAEVTVSRNITNIIFS